MKRPGPILFYLCFILLIVTACSPKTTETATSDDLTQESKASEGTNEVQKELIEGFKDDYAWPEATQEDNFDFDEETGTLMKYKGQDQVVVIPENIKGHEVVKIGKSCFEGQNHVTHVKLPDQVRVIQFNAFYFLEKLEKVHLSSKLEIIEPYAFFNCHALKQINIPPSVSYIGANAFLGFQGDVTFLGELPVLGDKALPLNQESSCKVRVSDEEKDRYEQALKYPCEAAGGCHYLNRQAKEDDFTVDSSGLLSEYRGHDHYLVIPDEIKEVKITAIAGKLFYSNQDLYRVKLPTGLETIGKSAFFGSNLVDVQFNDQLKEIGEEAFGACHFVNLQLPSSLTTITDKAFANITTPLLHIPEGITEISKGAFQKGNIEDLYLPASLKELGEFSFADNNSLTYVVFQGKTLPKIDVSAFKKCPLEDVDIPWDASKEDVEKVKQRLIELGFSEKLNVWRADHPDMPAYPASIEPEFDRDSGLATKFSTDEEHIAMFWYFEDPSGGSSLPVRGIASGLFKDSSIKSFYVPHSGQFTTIGDEAFANSQLEFIHLFDSVTSIGEKAFSHCKNLTSITIPESVEKIGAQAFEHCQNLKEVIFQGGSPSLERDLFQDCPHLTKVILPEGVNLSGPLGIDARFIRFQDSITDEKLAEEAAKLDYAWYQKPLRESDQDPFVDMPDQYKANAEEDFDFDSSTGTIKKYQGPGGTVVIPREIKGVKVEKIGLLAFSNFTVAAAAEGKGDETTLQAVILPETIHTIEDTAFLNCTTLKSFQCYGPLESLGVRAFEGCSALEEALFLNGLKTMGGYTFMNNESLKKVDFAGTLKELPEGAFFGCGFQDELRLDYESIGPSALQQCKKLKSLRIGKDVQSIQDGAFQAMDSLEKVYFEKADIAILGGSNYIFSGDNNQLKIILPKDATDEEVAAFVQQMKAHMFNNASSMVLRE